MVVTAINFGLNRLPPFHTWPHVDWFISGTITLEHRTFLITDGKIFDTSKNLKIRIFRNIILPVVLYGCETWSLTLREERRLRVFENRVLRRIFGPKRDEVTREWRKLHKEEPNNLNSSPNILRVIKSRRMR